MEGCPDCGSEEGYNCDTCCPHVVMEKKNVSNGSKGRYLTEIAKCQACGYFVVLNEIDYRTEFPSM